MLKGFCMQKKFLVLLTTIGLGLISAPVYADGFSASIDTSLPSFSASIALNYTYSLAPVLTVGGGVLVNADRNGTAQVGFHIGALYDQKVIDSPDGFLELYLGVRLYDNTSTFSVWVNPYLGLKAEFSVADKVKLYGGFGVILYFPITTSSTIFDASAQFGLKYALEKDIELSAALSGYLFSSVFQNNIIGQNGASFNINAKYTTIPAFEFNAGLGIGLYSFVSFSQPGSGGADFRDSFAYLRVYGSFTYALAPQIKIGTLLALSMPSSGSNGLSITIFGSFIQNPGTPGTPDTRIP
jgi:hypothetical protein